MGHMLPIHLDADVDGVLHERVLDALDAVEVFHGPAHTEVIVRDGKVSIIEVNARPAGSPIPAMIQLVTGVNLYQHSLDWFLGRNMRAEPQKLTGKGAAVRHFGPPPGRLVAIRGLERVRLIGGVKEIVLKVAPGDRIHPLRSAFDRVGYLTAVAATAEDAYSICREACAADYPAMDCRQWMS
jgi:cysteine synthase A